MSEPPIRVHRVCREDLDLIQETMPARERFVGGERMNSHAQRFGDQESGSADYLIAWLDHRPVGHALVRWNGSGDAFVRENGVRDPYIEGVAVHADVRRRGIATAMMIEAERMARERGFAALVLAAGIENGLARALYDRLGYCDIKLPEFDATWTSLDDDGRERVEHERCTLLRKALVGE